MTDVMEKCRPTKPRLTVKDLRAARAVPPEMGRKKIKGDVIHKAGIECDAYSTEFTVNVGKWRAIGDERRVTRRLGMRPICIEFGAEGKAWGQIRMTEFRAAVSSHVFYEDCDENSSELEAMASALISAWPIIDDVSWLGTIVMIDEVWIAPGTPPGVWADVANMVLENYLRDHALIIFKAFPLEHVATDGRGPKGRLQRRQRALMRLYVSIFNVTALPGFSGSDGWMYRWSERIDPYHRVEPVCVPYDYWEDR